MVSYGSRELQYFNDQIVVLHKMAVHNSSLYYDKK